MTPRVLQYVEAALSDPEVAGDVLEVGSYNVNGSVRPLFSDRSRFPSYLGVDMRPGPGVDQVMFASNLVLFDQQFGVVVSTEMLEHDGTFWLSLREFRRVLRWRGAVIVTTRGIGFPRHDYPDDCYRFTGSGLLRALEAAGFNTIDVIESDADQGVFATAWRLS